LSGVLTGRQGTFALPPVDDRDGLRDLYAFDARVTGADLAMNDVHLTAEWSEFEHCHFSQKVRPVLNEHGFAAQGSFANSPTVYRGCTFERVRFKILGGFSMGKALFEGCTFVNCRWEGHFAYQAWLIDNRFVGKMNGCVWFGRDDRDRANLIKGNDFTETQFTANVGFRSDFPVDDQLWPVDYTPSTDD
jgi:hypothetical protein